MENDQSERLGVKLKEDLHIRTFGFCRSDIFKSTGVIVRRGSKEEEEKHVAGIYALEKLSERGLEEK